MDAIKEANEGLPEGLKAGQLIKIPVMGGANEPQIQYDRASSETHTVVKGETPYSVAKLYGLSISDIYEANPGTENGLKIGQVLVIPSKTSEQKDSNNNDVSSGSSSNYTSESTNGQRYQDDIPSGFDHFWSGLQFGSHQEFRTLSPSRMANVALLLPLGSEEKPSQYYLDFYRGFLIGLEQVRMSGHSVELNLFNTARRIERVESIIQSGELNQADLVVGPVYEDELSLVVSALQEKGTPIVSPLENLTHTSSSSVFQMSPLPTAKYNKVRDLFNGSRRVVIISADEVDGRFDAEVRGMLREGTRVVSHKYIYEHQSVVAKRAASGSPSPSDLTYLLRGKEKTVIVITAKKDVDVDRILTALASAKLSLVDRSQSVVPFVTLVNNSWSRSKTIDKTLFFKNNVTMLSKYYSYRSDDKIRNFDKLFVMEYNSLPSPYAYRGYDAAVVFVPALYGGIETGLEGISFEPLMTPYIFRKVGSSGVHKNTQWVKINYNDDYTITIE
jgi:hypothetical protein